MIEKEEKQWIKKKEKKSNTTIMKTVFLADRELECKYFKNKSL